jgi:uncharacterized damage-inducible protein DinB
MRAIAQALAALAVLFVAVPSARAQQPPRPDNVRDVFLAGWNEVGEKLVKMAEEFPEEKFEYKPADGVRTFGDVLRHVAFWNQWVAKTARGEKPDGKPNELPKAEFGTKAKVIAALKSSVAEAAGELKKQAASPGPREAGLWASFISHSSEHYGQLVVYYRLNGLVPPASRGTN